MDNADAVFETILDYETFGVRLQEKQVQAAVFYYSWNWGKLSLAVLLRTVCVCVGGGGY